MRYVDLVIVEVDGVKILCQAPSFSHLKKGDKVVAGEHIVDVVASDLFRANDTDAINLVLNAFDVENINEVPKLKSRVTITDFIYDDDEKGGETDD